MNWIESLLIIAGVLLDVFATMEIQGAMLSQIRKRTLLLACAVVAAIELVFYFLGYFGAWFLADRGYIANPIHYGEAVAVVVLTLLGIRLLVKAVKREFIQEKWKDSIRVVDYARIVVVSSFYTAIAGCVCGLVGITIWQIVILIVAISIVMVIMGLYTGLHFGFENKTKAYLIGAALLWGVSLEMLLHRVLEVV